MNIMSNGSFLDEMNASNKQSELVKKLTSAWEQKNTKAARAGGVSLMALSLAACGGSDDTAFSQADIDAAKVTALTDASGTAHATVDVAITSNDTAISTAATTTALTGSDGRAPSDAPGCTTSSSPRRARGDSPLCTPLVLCVLAMRTERRVRPREGGEKTAACAPAYYD